MRKHVKIVEAVAQRPAGPETGIEPTAAGQDDGYKDILERPLDAG